MDPAGASELRVTRMDRKKAVKASEEISSLLREAFEKHKTVCRGYHKLEEELRLLQIKSDQDSATIERLRKENQDLSEDASDAYAKIAELSNTVNRLEIEVEHWNRKACAAKQAQKSDEPASTRIPSPKKSNSWEVVKGRVSEAMFGEQAVRSIEEFQTGNNVVCSKIRRQLFPSDSRGTLTTEKKDDLPESHSDRKRKGSEVICIPETPPPKPLQTNTCKVCERYWRAEDARIPGQLKTFDVPYCKIHGKNHRPACTPENFWKHARLSSPSK